MIARLDIRCAAMALRAMRFLRWLWTWVRDVVLFIVLLAVLLVCIIFDVDLL
jgi:hypothetical protein